jgi:hypothetical protein
VEVSRANLVALMAGGGDPAAMEALVGLALADLGWQAKESFSRLDVMKVTGAIAELAQAELAASPDPATRKFAEGLAALLGAIR